MIEVEFSGTVKAVNTNRSETVDGNTAVCNVVTKKHVRTKLVFEDGYVNLEAFSPSRAPDVFKEGFVDNFGIVDHPDMPDNSRDTDWFIGDHDISMNGSVIDWIRQAKTWTSERPSESLGSALRTFREWDETDDRPIEEAIKQVEERSHHDH